MGLQFAIHFRARHTDPTGWRKLALRNPLTRTDLPVLEGAEAPAACS
jgi:hypothetical protein